MSIIEQLLADVKSMTDKVLELASQDQKAMQNAQELLDEAFVKLDSLKQQAQEAEQLHNQEVIEEMIEHAKQTQAELLQKAQEYTEQQREAERILEETYQNTKPTIEAIVKREQMRETFGTLLALGMVGLAVVGIVIFASNKF
jgi:TRAP-type mannitol/chloroaromatic compound transport system substrate-binding protein